MKTQTINIGLLSASLLLCISSNLSFAQIDTVNKRSQAVSLNTTVIGSNTSMTGSNTQVAEVSDTRMNPDDTTKRASSKRTETIAIHHKRGTAKRSEPNK